MGKVVPLHRVSAPAADWPALLQRILDDPTQPRLVFQPIIDLRRGSVAGYEALARFDDGPHGATPDQYFSAAGRGGLATALEARVLERALEALRRLPPNRFLTVNLSPAVLQEPAIMQLLLSHGRLSGLVVEITEHEPVTDYDALGKVLARLRDHGVTIAVDDAGSGYSGLQHLALLRPQLVKLDRSLVDRADTDEAKLAVAELLGAFVGRLDAWLLAEGIERVEELDAFLRLGVPLGQGWLFGRPSAAFSELDADLAAHIRAVVDRGRMPELVSGLVERVPTAPAGPRRAAEGGSETIALLDLDGRATHLMLPADGVAGSRIVAVSLRTGLNGDVGDLAARAMARAAAQRFDPVVCTDVEGRFLGLVPVGRLVQRLVQLRDPRHPVTSSRPTSNSSPDHSAAPAALPQKGTA